jgi:hypothetical protein
MMRNPHDIHNGRNLWTSRPIAGTHMITGEPSEPRPATRVSEEPLGGLHINRAAHYCLNVPAF